VDVRVSRNWILLLVGLVFATSCLADIVTEPFFEQLTIDQGLPGNSVRAILQDRHGFLWFGTQNGLVRYDGQEMLTFRQSPTAGVGFGGLIVESLLEDHRGDLWAGTFVMGVWRRNNETGEFREYSLDPLGAGDDGSVPVFDLCEDSMGRIWLALSEHGLARLDPEDGSLSLIAGGKSGKLLSPGTLVSNVTFMAPNRIWVGTNRGILIIDDTGQFVRRHEQNSSTDSGLPEAEVNDIFKDSRGRIWVSTDDGLARWNADTGRFTVFCPVPKEAGRLVNHCGKIFEGKRGNLWISSFNGIHVFNPKQSTFQSFVHDPARPGSLPEGPTLGILVDNSEVVWVGTWQRGLAKLALRRQKFSLCHHDPTDPTSLPSDQIPAIHEDSDGVFWTGSSRCGTGGMDAFLSRRLGDTCSFEHFPLPNPDGRRTNLVRAICEDLNGGLWVGADSGLWRFDRSTETFSFPEQQIDPESPDWAATVSTLLTDSAGNLWAGTIGAGLLRVDSITGEWQTYRHDPSDKNSLGEDVILSLMEDSQKQLWIGTDSHGLNIFHPETGKFQRFFQPEFGLSTVVDIFEDSGKRIWLASVAGLFQLDPEGTILTRYDRQSGLPNGLVISILEDNQNRLWLSTGAGLVWLDPGSGRTGSFGLNDGIISDQVYTAHARLQDGTLVFGGNKGLIRFDPDQLEPDPTAPPIVITEIRLNGQPLIAGGSSPMQKVPYLTDELILSHDQHDLSIDFSALHFSRPERNRYRYRLAPNGETWYEVLRGHTANFTNLSPGSYVFQVQGCNVDGLWNEEGASLGILVHPPWWLRGWAYALYLALAILALWGLHRILLARERVGAELKMRQAEARRLEELDQLKSRVLVNISHEIRTPLTLIQGQLKRLFPKTPAPDRDSMSMVIRNTERLSQLLDQLMDLSRLDVGKLTPCWKLDEDLTVLRALTATYGALAEDRSVAFKANFPATSKAVWLEPDVLQKTVGNLLDNAIKFTPAGGKVTLTAQWEKKDMLLVTVLNSGSYISSEQQKYIFDRFYQTDTKRVGSTGSGIGLALVKEMVKLVNGRVTVTSSLERGTSFTVYLPALCEAPNSGSVLEVAASTKPVSPRDKEDDISMRPLLLVVDDHPDMRSYLQDVLLAANYRVVLAVDGEDAQNQAQAETPDLIVSDVMMPGIDGFELCRRLREDQQTSHIPVILLTALNEQNSCQEGLLSGAVEYLTKPFDSEDLCIRISNLLERQHRLGDRLARLIREQMAKEPQIESAEDQYLQDLRDAIDRHLDDPDFKIDELCKEMGTSRSQLHRKLTAVTGLSATGFVREHRLQRAAGLLAAGQGYVTEVAYAVGFQSLSYFTRCFRDQYGVVPSQYPPKN